MYNQLIIALLAFFILCFQNCSPVEFQALGEATARPNAFEIADECVSLGDCSENAQVGEHLEPGDRSTVGDGIVESTQDVTGENNIKSPNNEGDEVIEIPQDSGRNVGDKETGFGGKNKKEREVASVCGVSGISDIVLNVKYVEMGQQVVGSLIGSLSLKEISKGFEIVADTDVEGSQVKLVLEDEGNYIRDVNGDLKPLKTPSQQSSGLMVLVAKTQMAANGVYRLSFDLNLDKQVVINPVKCLLKPVIKKGILN